jgi:hypothetical protein
MAEKRKSIIDEAFMEAESIDKAFKANAKEILAQTMSSEIEEMVKESLKEDWKGLEEDEDEEEIEDLEFDDSDLASLDAGDDLDLDLGDDEEGDDLDFDLGDDEDEDVVVHDLTDANDEEVVNVFKKMSPEDEIEVVQDGNNIDIKDNATGAEYRIELGGSDDTEMFDDEDMFDDENTEMFDDEENEDDEDFNRMGEEVIYEIHLSEDEEGDDDEYMADEYMTDKDEEIGENVTRNYSNGRKQTLKPDNYPSKFKRPGVRNESTTPRVSGLINENKVLKETISSIKSENETLKEDYNKMVDALKEFRNKLNEVAVFNSNLTYTVRLFTEHSTTKDEKVDIIKRFDEAGSLKESKNIYKNLVKEISKTKAPIKESIENKINETKGSGSATQITESKVYVNPEFEKMKQLWSYDYKK